MLAREIEQSGTVVSSSRLDTRVLPYVRILNGALDDDPGSPAGIILQGRIDPGTFRFLKVDANHYQRPCSDREDIFDALKQGKVPPPIDIGVRGQDFVSDGSDYLVRSPAYIVDGGQRLGNAQRLLELIPDLDIRLFAMVHFNTDAAWEASRFDALNKNIKKVSPSLHLRNMRDRNEAVLTLFGLCHNERDFPLFERVCWSQDMARVQLMTASVLAKTAVMLHARHTPLGGVAADAVAVALKRASSVVTLPVFRSNVATFFAIINGCWPFAETAYRHSATQLKNTFLAELARMFSDYDAFWDATGTRLTVSADDRRKLASFPLNDTQVINLAGTGGKARRMLYQLLVNHMNSGRRTNRLVSRFDRKQEP